MDYPLCTYIKILKYSGRHIFKSAVFFRITFLNMNFIPSKFGLKTYSSQTFAKICLTNKSHFVFLMRCFIYKNGSVHLLGLTLVTTFLQLWHDLTKYKKHDPRIANVASKAFERLLVLTEECAVFSLFSNCILDNECQEKKIRQNRTSLPKSFEKDTHDSDGPFRRLFILNFFYFVLLTMGRVWIKINKPKLSYVIYGQSLWLPFEFLPPLILLT